MLRWFRSRLTYEEFIAASLIAALAFACMVCGALIVTAHGADDLDLPVDKPAPVASKTVASGPIGNWKKPEPKPIEIPSEEHDDPPPKFFGTEIRSSSMSVFYVIDISGSMAYDLAPYAREDGSASVGNRLDRAKAELLKSVAQLPGEWKFDVLAYDCSSTSCFPGMRLADAQAKVDASAWVRALQPGGGTGTGYAVALALRADVQNKLVVLLTDGAPNCYLGGLTGSDDDFSRHLQAISEANTQGAAVDVFGIGATGQFKRFCEEVAGRNGGTYTDVR